MNFTPTELGASIIFAIAVLHTFCTSYFVYALFVIFNEYFKVIFALNKKKEEENFLLWFWFRLRFYIMYYFDL